MGKGNAYPWLCGLYNCNERHAKKCGYGGKGIICIIALTGPNSISLNRTSLFYHSLFTIQNINSCSSYKDGSGVVWWFEWDCVLYVFVSAFCMAPGVLGGAEVYVLVFAYYDAYVVFLAASFKCGRR
jgi:hypothetical protein